MKHQLVNPTEIAYAAEHACGAPFRLCAVILPARNDGRDTKPGEIKRLWAAYLRKR